MKKKMKQSGKSVVAWMLAACCGIACVPTHASATEQVFVGGENYRGHVEVPGMLPPESIYEGPDVVQGTSSIPAAYDSRDYGNVTSIKDQNPYGTCWSFATMAVMESSLLSQGIYEDVDLSEYHLIYYSFNGVTDDPLGGTSNDSITYSHDMATALETGGNATVAYHALANWVGAVEEDMVPYPTVTGSVESLPGTTESAYLNDVVHLQQAYIMNKSDTAAIKQFIMDYGAVTGSFFYDANFLNGDAYYTNHYTGSNHAITLIGWDDNYSKTNFRTQPGKNGAWLVKNSWDTWFGDEGYFWLSYEDTSLQDTFCAFVAESADNYDNNYQYDGTYLNSNYTFTEAKVANVFQAKAGTWGETLGAVAFETTSVNLNYSVQIYTDLTDATDPTSGKARLSQPVTGTTTFQGYYTVELPQSVLLQPGQTFSVVISLNKGGEEFRVPVETDFTWNLGLGDYITYTANAEANQSFMEYDNYDYWWDVGAAKGTNVRVKAFTTNTAPVPISLAKEAEKMLVDGEMQLRIKGNDVCQPISVNSHYNWSVEPQGVVEVSESGMLTGLGVGTATVTCTHKQCSDITASVDVEIEIPFTDIKLTDWQYPFVVYVYKNNLMSGKKEHVFDMNGKLTRSEFVTVLYSYSEKPAVVYEQCFTDVPKDKWFTDAIIWAKQNNVTVGNPDGTFGVYNNITREQLVVMLYGYAKNKGLVDGEVQIDLSAYSDLDKVSNWAKEAFSWAVQNSIVSGKTNKVDNTPILDPKGNATRGECATIMKGFVELIK